MTGLHRVLSLLLLTAVASTVAAAGLPQPTGPVILTVDGAIDITNGDGVARFDRAMLEGLAQHVTRTHIPWTEGEVKFEGPLGRTLLDAVGAHGKKLVVTALNDYSADVPVSDFYDHDVILALKMNGDYLRIRDKGPLFIIYPFDADPALNTEVIYNRSVWQIKKMHVE